MRPLSKPAQNGFQLTCFLIDLIDTVPGITNQPGSPVRFFPRLPCRHGSLIRIGVHLTDRGIDFLQCACGVLYLALLFRGPVAGIANKQIKGVDNCPGGGNTLLHGCGGTHHDPVSRIPGILE